MKKTFLSVIISFIFLLPLTAQVNISLEPIVSTTLGKNDEYVYSFSGRSIVSKLEWQQLPLCKVGAAAEFSVNNLLINADFFYGLPLKCGKMYDSDWNGYGIKTTYSISNNYAKENYNFSFSAGYMFELKKIELIPQISFEYAYDFFQSNEGHGWYGSENYSKSGSDVSWDSSEAKYYSKLSRINLKRKNWYVFSGLNISIPIGDSILIQAGSFIAPFAYTYNSDYHFDDTGRTQGFYLNSCQEMYFSRFKECLGIKYKINQKLTADFSTNIIFGGIRKGWLEGWEQYGGTDLFLADLRFGLRVDF